MDDITFDTPAEMISKCIVCDDNENDTDTKLYKLKCIEK